MQSLKESKLKELLKTSDRLMKISSVMEEGISDLSCKLYAPTTNVVDVFTAINLHTFSTRKAFNKYRDKIIPYLIYLYKKLDELKNVIISLTILYEGRETNKFLSSFESKFNVLKRTLIFTHVSFDNNFKSNRREYFKCRDQLRDLLNLVSNFHLKVLHDIGTKSI